MKICYVPKDFNPEHQRIIDRANQIVSTYKAQGYSLTLRQVYYQFVARGWLENHDRSYDRLGCILNDARLAGEMDWEAMEDRTRYLRKKPHWETPADIVDAVASQFHLDLWHGQEHRVEVWVEKDALVGVIEAACDPLDIPHFSCRGYTSQTELWNAAQRMIEHSNQGHRPVVLHFGDHDPSGIDMSRDIQDRLALYMRHEDIEPPEFERLALNMDQVRRYKPPPNPAKLSDSRCAKYIAEHGDKSWELDALEPSVLRRLVEAKVSEYIDADTFNARKALRQVGRELLSKVSDRWEEVAAFVSRKGK